MMTRKGDAEVRLNLVKGRRGKIGEGRGGRRKKGKQGGREGRQEGNVYFA